jgi:hypothetical protein
MSSSKIGFVLLLVALSHSAARCQTTPPRSSSGDEERVALLPFEIRGLSVDDGLLLRQKFGEILAESGRFDVMPDNVLRNNLNLAGLANIDSCNTLACLGQLGKVLKVEKVVHVTVDQWRERYVLQIRAVRSSDAALLYGERVDYAGQYNGLLSTVVPEQARKLSAAYLDRRPNWFLIAALVIIGVGLIYWLSLRLTPKSSREAEFPGSTPTPQ